MYPSIWQDCRSGGAGFEPVSLGGIAALPQKGQTAVPSSREAPHRLQNISNTLLNSLF